MTSIDSGINTIMRGSTASATVTKDVHAAILTLQQKVEKGPEMTSKQFKVLHEQMGGLAAEFEMLRSLQLNGVQDISAPKEEADAENLASDPEVVESISRLCQLAQHNAATLHNSEAQRVIDDIETMIELMMKHLSHTKLVPTSSRKRPLTEMEGSTVDHRELKRVKGVLVSSSAIDTNKQSKLSVCI